MNVLEHDILSRQKSVKLTSSEPIASWNYNLKKMRKSDEWHVRLQWIFFSSFRDQIEAFLHIDFAIDFIGNIFTYCSVWCAPIVAWILMAYDILWNDWKKYRPLQNGTKQNENGFAFDSMQWFGWGKSSVRGFLKQLNPFL